MPAASAIYIMDFGAGIAEVCKLTALSLYTSYKDLRKLPGQTRPVPLMRSLCINAFQIAPPGSFIIHTYLNISHQVPMYPPRVDKDHKVYARLSV